MKNYKKIIAEYSRQIESQIISEEKIGKTIALVKQSMLRQRERMLSYAEFVFFQSKFIKKRWWLLQALFLLALWLLLGDMSDDYYLPRLLGLGAPLFVSLILPEIWKNRKYYSIEIESSSFYTLKQIYSARMILFALIDILLLSAFWAITGLPVEIFIVNFILPLNICCSICFRLLCIRKVNMELTMMMIGIWTVIWMVILANDSWYQRLVLPIWGLYLALSLTYLVYCVYKLLSGEEEILCN
ncbi:hypothetical protein EII17_07425 [Clostridiales bacterium COT073_COT-073]|nr:hypothetical protein EII17_07425 [Clostridiales bacterium COT073_COT-073]